MDDDLSLRSERFHAQLLQQWRAAALQTQQPTRLLTIGRSFETIQDSSGKKRKSGILPGRSLAEGKTLSWICLLSLRSSSAVMGRSKVSRIIWQASSAFLPITSDFTAHVYCFLKRSHISWKATVYSRSVSKMRRERLKHVAKMCSHKIVFIFL